jgi:hypothetical protein
VRRTPELPDNTIARTCHSSATAVRAARERILTRSAGAA